MHLPSQAFTTRSRTALPFLSVTVASGCSIIWHREAQLSPCKGWEGVTTATGFPLLDTGIEARAASRFDLKREGKPAYQITTAGIDLAKNTVFTGRGVSASGTLNTQP